MCGRFTLDANELDILREYDVENEISHQPRYNVAPGQEVLAIIHDGEKKRAGFLKWGLVPSWAKDSKIGYKMINARSETAHEKPSFKQLLSRKRCLILADSFYEWQKTEEGKQPKRIMMKDRKLFAFAGLWDQWRQGDNSLFTCTILTKDADSFMRPIHDRMPVILPKEKEMDWLFPVQRDIGHIHQFVTRISTETMVAYDVSTKVNAVKHDDETCIQPLI
ncbi:SOS response-associated peptidase [Aquibacillus koreensis]|uniref:Abasic site processing protein n=1 Tax=Aquibacillus koreensis TaxID=279446 RepID=A0A9X4AJF8_9BACI|nr:SOS response-associated peptidase [Aquibacillus koreensis]MCT2534442.1 SOS response-associated peptidase [Aquibacillus koreensis]MDC3421749.1 SOS response-associated peptidase [Aquibacillus koreensis]